MKKIISVILALLLIVSLTACGAEKTEPEPSPAPAPEKTDDAAPAEEPSAQPDTPEDDSIPAGSIQTTGWYKDAMENAQSREPYHIAYITCSLVDVIHSSMDSAFEQWSRKINVNYSNYDANGDNDAFLNAIDTLAVQGADGFLFDADITISGRVREIVDELGIPWMAALSPFLDENNEHYSAPSVVSDSWGHGASQVKWLFENYKSYWGEDVKPEEIGFIFCDFSINAEIHLRAQGAIETYKALNPDLYDSNFFYLDIIGPFGPGNMQGAFDDVSTTITANTNEYSHWMVATCSDEFGVGAARGITSLGLDDKCLVISCFGDTLMKEWDNGYDGAWVATVTTSPLLLAEPMICGLVALLDGRATYDNLWCDSVPEGETYGLITMPADIITKDNVSSYISNIDDYIK
ncbi:MAG: hypothetical protein HUJ65_03680 [Oscillospiraceae bacterium]|nr:hypothetical protein [Oscillospiraceae bacterium]